MSQGTPDRTYGEAVGTPDVHGSDAELLTEAEHSALTPHTSASRVTVDPSGLLVVTGTDVQAAIAELDAAVDAAGSGASSDLLARHIYNPATSVSVSTAGPTLVDVDATNAAITFTVPASGDVLILVSLLHTLNANGNDRLLGLREGTTNVVVNTSGDLNASANYDRRLVPLHVTGLTPGAEHTYKLSFASDTGTHTIQAGRSVVAAFNAAPGPLILEVHAA